MILDESAIEPGSRLTADVAIVGAGPAGITLALELAGFGIDVILLEAGGRDYDAAAQDAYAGSVAEDSLHPTPELYRRRMLGGSSSIWGGRCVPLDPIDFEKRPFVPHSGWPFGYEDLEPYYHQAQVWCEAGDYDFTVRGSLGPSAPPTIAGYNGADFDWDHVDRFSPPTNFGHRYRERLEREVKVRVILGAACLEINQAEAGPIRRLVMAGRGDRRFTVTARHYVVSAGGIETVRLLMVSDQSQRGGIGNETGNLGRYYMCHLENTIGEFRASPEGRGISYDIDKTPDDIYLFRKFQLRETSQRDQELLNAIFRLHYPVIADPVHGNAILSAMYLVKDAIIPEYRRKLATIERSARDTLTRDIAFWGRHALNLARDPIRLAAFSAFWIRRRVLAKRKVPFVMVPNRQGIYPLDFNLEQAPNPESRIRLNDERDAVGQRRITVDWRITELDVRSFIQTIRLLERDLQRSGVGTVKYDPERLEDGIRRSTPVGGHHIGTARMSATSKEGVVDRDCRVWSCPNLHLAGSAVFPTSGHANPTLTIVALSLRLAGHLRELTAKDGSLFQDEPSICA
ncbi:GMC family oxidoreductase (plasmid) [Skermanella sp. TT6]|uniref:GMC family oxidoreductase n=1 Tax=Skermanella cutis TaxID=2775420 RepID=A0ABX7BEA9_9PROT|nr:GMC family oxidoreductase [Skermanella sp. TT6]QQP92755.1 GMC family oxidoreductase [Skermanella sp. TT6]